MAECMVLGCGCSNKYQDKIYGAGKRACNPTGTTNVYHCSVCGTNRSPSARGLELVARKSKKNVQAKGEKKPKKGQR